MNAQASTLRLFWLGAAHGPNTAGARLGLEFSVRDADAKSLADFLRGVDARCHVAASTTHVGAALALVIEHAAKIDTLILVSPSEISGIDAALVGKLKALEIPTLILFGALMSPHPEAPGTQWRRAFTKAHLTYVFDAADPIDAARPDAVASLMQDFMTRRDGFLVRLADDRIHP